LVVRKEYGSKMPRQFMKNNMKLYGLNSTYSLLKYWSKKC